MKRRIRRADRLQGTVEIPGDKSISHRYALLAGIAEGRSEIEHFATSRDCRSTLGCLQALGVEVREDRGVIAIAGRGLRGLAPPSTPLDAGNSGTTIRLLAGILAGHPFETTLTGDESLSRRPMNRVIEPLAQMGARVVSQSGGLPPLRITGGPLRAIRYPLPVPSAQVKSCVLLAGLYGDGPTSVGESIPTRDHTEIALELFGARLERDTFWIELSPGPRLEGQRLVVPSDLSGAAFFMVAASIVEGSDVRLPGVGLNRRRRELVEYLIASGADIAVEEERERHGEPRGDLRVRFSPAFLDRGLAPLNGALAAALIDEIPALAVHATQTRAGVEISDARELRVKESDRIAALATNRRAMGVEVEERPDGLRVGGGQRLRGATIDPRGDHRIAMAFAVAGLAAEGETTILDAECADVSFPGFYDAVAHVAGRGAVV
jgi:3-phosphoshikimate 1-carboxyvinyltransferase